MEVVLVSELCLYHPWWCGCGGCRWYRWCYARPSGGRYEYSWRGYSTSIQPCDGVLPQLLEELRHRVEWRWSNPSSCTRTCPRLGGRSTTCTTCNRRTHTTMGDRDITRRPVQPPRLNLSIKVPSKLMIVVHRRTLEMLKQPLPR